MSASVIFVVGARYLFNSAPAWGEELPRILLIWGSFLGAVVAARNGSHLRAGLLPMLIGNPRLLKNIERLTVCLSILACFVLVYASFDLVQRTARNSLPALHVSVGWVYAAGMVGFAALALVLIFSLVPRKEEP